MFAEVALKYAFFVYVLYNTALDASQSALNATLLTILVNILFLNLMLRFLNIVSNAGMLLAQFL